MAAQNKNEVINAKQEMAYTYQVNGEELTLTPTVVKNYLTRGNGAITGQEAVLFMNLCKYQKLNPFLNEAYLVKFGDQPAQLITGKDAFMKRAENHEQFDGYRAGLIINRDNEVIEVEGSFTIQGDVLLGGWCEVYRLDRKNPIIAKVNIEEYNKGKALWKDMPKTMIRKTAMVQALREAFPANLGGMYVEEEMTFEQAVPVEDKVKEEIKQEANKKPLIIKNDKPPVEEFQDAEVIDPDEEPDF
ncbi:MAG: phage recombination protein Bet [Clostridiaceae bacterium]|jgi:phage recombination protein Bet|nr:phage recombination protein Bet [Clostridiaceae bacterium]